jgi:hypothetical protein
MNASLLTADRATHVKIVAISMSVALAIALLALLVH